MVELMKLLSEQKSDMVEMVKVATSSEGRSIYGVKVQWYKKSKRKKISEMFFCKKFWKSQIHKFPLINSNFLQNFNTGIKKLGVNSSILKISQIEPRRDRNACQKCKYFSFQPNIVDMGVKTLEILWVIRILHWKLFFAAGNFRNLKKKPKFFKVEN